MDFIISWVRSGLLFSVFASVVLMLSPNKTYMKYISLVIGLLFILVMIHPVMKALNLDTKTYVSYIENLLRLDGTEENMTRDHKELYEDSIALQLIVSLKESGYEIDDIAVEVNDSGAVEEIHIVFAGEVKGLKQIEDYVCSLFGKEVSIYYENAD